MQHIDFSDSNSSISLSFSGGGHRATLYSAGVFAYLVDAGFSERIDTISSVSGGSLTNGVIAAHCATNQKSISEFSRQEWQEILAKLSKEVAGSPLFWVFAALGLSTLVIFYAAFLFSDAESKSSLHFLVAFWIVMPVALFLLRHVYGCHLVAVLVWISAVAIACWYSYIFGGAITHTEIYTFVVVTMILLSFIGSLGGGSFWSSSSTWLIFSFSFWGLLTGLDLIFDHFWTIVVSIISIWDANYSVEKEAVDSSTSAVVIGILVSSAFSLLLNLRNIVADRSFAQLLNRIVGSKKLRLGDLKDDCKHVFCTTLVDYGTQLYLTKNTGQFVVSSTRTRLNCSEIALSSAIQMSAAFPGGFPYRIVELDLCDGEKSGLGNGRYIVTDGGVVDNSGVSWFLDFQENADGLENLIVADSSRYHSSSSDFGHYVPFIQDLKSIFGVMSTTLNIVERGHTSYLSDHVNQKESQINVFEVEAKLSPEHEAARILRFRDDLEVGTVDGCLKKLEAAAMVSLHDSVANPRSLASTDWSRDFLKRIKEIKKLTSGSDRADEETVVEYISKLLLMKDEERTPSGNPLTTINEFFLRFDAYKEFTVPTTFRPLGKKSAEECLRRGYCHAMQKMHLVTGGTAPIFDRTQSDFSALAKGIPLKEPMQLAAVI